MSISSISCGYTFNLPNSKNFRSNPQNFSQFQVKPYLYALPFRFYLSKSHNYTNNRLFYPITASNNGTSTVETSKKQSFRSKNPKDINVLVVGSTGYIGKFVVKELVKRGFNVIAVAREKSGIRGKYGKDDTLTQLNGANVCFSDVTNLDVLETNLQNFRVDSIDVVVSCLASRNGGVKDSWLIDYEATKNSLLAGRKLGAVHFVLLSAICVQKPLLEFQRAKLKFEDDLIHEAEKDEGFSYSIVRPTAFFKSLGGQVELVKDGKPYVMFGDGKLCACKPMSEPDLASFIADSVLDKDKINQVLPIGGPGKALTPLEQGEMLFKLVGKEPKFIKVPIEIMDFAIGVLDFLAKIVPSLEDAAEFGKIGRYYAAESMLVLDPETGEYNAETLWKSSSERFSQKVKVDMGEPILTAVDVPTKLPANKESAVVKSDIVVDGGTWSVTCVSMGNPHCITFGRKGEQNLLVDQLKLADIGPKFEHHDVFPARTNTEFVQVFSRSHLKMRVWERGAGATLACGTGACAVVVAAVLEGRAERNCTVDLPGGPLEIEWREEDNHVYMTGPAEVVFYGSLQL